MGRALAQGRRRIAAASWADGPRRSRPGACGRGRRRRLRTGGRIASSFVDGDRPQADELVTPAVARRPTLKRSARPIASRYRTSSMITVLSVSLREPVQQILEGVRVPATRRREGTPPRWPPRAPGRQPTQGNRRHRRRRARSRFRDSRVARRPYVGEWCVQVELRRRALRPRRRSYCGRPSKRVRQPKLAQVLGLPWPKDDPTAMRPTL